mmetsp:Transcript_3069/g.4509  ORF Transcript_3069/g.4509 Transcript_3069/m.4509 type:complete len:151 (+) Transcript_3069:27-479(+)
MKILITFVMCILFLASFISMSSACSCARTTPLQSILSSDVFFRGRVIATRRTSNRIMYQVRVTRACKGLERNQMVRIVSYNNTCGVNYLRRRRVYNFMGTLRGRTVLINLCRAPIAGNQMNVSQFRNRCRVVNVFARRHSIQNRFFRSIN